MARPWQLVDSAPTPDGTLELRQRAADDFLILVEGRVLMNSRASRSERALAELACGALGDVSAPRVLIGGLGMGCTVRAALDGLPQDAQVVVAELHPVVESWCRGPLAALNGHALADARVQVAIGDVADAVGRACDDRSALDAILLDLFEGPHPGTDPQRDPFYGVAAIERARNALRPGGVLAVWGEAPDAPFERRLARAGFDVECRRPGRGGRRHAVFLARRRG